MIPINPTAKLILFVAITAILAGLGALMKVEPGWTWIAGVVAILGYVEAYLTPAPATAKKVPTVPTALTTLALCLGFSAAVPAHVSAYRTSANAVRTVVAWNARAAVRLAAVISLCLAILVAACTPSTGTTVATVAAPVATTAVCIITTYATDSAAGMKPPAIVLDIVGKCGVDALTIAQVLDAQARAETIAKGAAAPVAAAAHALATDAGAP